MALGERAEQVAPLVPVLRPAVQEQDDVVALAGLGDVEGDPVGADEPVADAVDVREVGWQRHGRGRYRRAASSCAGCLASLIGTTSAGSGAGRSSCSCGGESRA